MQIQPCILNGLRLRKTGQGVCRQQVSWISEFPKRIVGVCSIGFPLDNCSKCSKSIEQRFSPDQISWRITSAVRPASLKVFSFKVSSLNDSLKAFLQALSMSAEPMTSYSSTLPLNFLSRNGFSPLTIDQPTKISFLWLQAVSSSNLRQGHGYIDAIFLSVWVSVMLVNLRFSMSSRFARDLSCALFMVSDFSMLASTPEYVACMAKRQIGWKDKEFGVLVHLSGRGNKIVSLGATSREFPFCPLDLKKCRAQALMTSTVDIFDPTASLDWPMSLSTTRNTLSMKVDMPGILTIQLYLLIRYSQFKKAQSHQKFSNKLITSQLQKHYHGARNIEFSLNHIPSFVLRYFFSEPIECAKKAHPNIQLGLYLCELSGEVVSELPALKQFARGKTMQEPILYEVEKVLRKKTIAGEACYLVKWKGYPMEEATWQPLENIGHLHKDLRMLEPRTREKKRRPRKTKKIRDVKGGAPSAGSRTQKGSIADFQEHPESSEKISSCFRAFSAGTRADEEKYPVKVLEKLWNARSQVTFRLRKEDEIFALTDKQTKLLFPAELSLFYEEEFKHSIGHVTM